jgi:hypothetical protein
VAAVALVAERRRSCLGAAHRGKDRAELLAQLRRRGGKAVFELGAQVGVERLDQHPEGAVALELGRLAVEDDVAAILAAPAQLRQQAALADSRLSFDRDATRVAAVERRQRSVEPFELVLASHERLPERRHRLCRA